MMPPEIISTEPCDVHLVDTSPACDVAESSNGVLATLFHDAGAIAQCIYCRRYTLDRRALGDRPPRCECGKKHGWTGSFRLPGPTSSWCGAPPAAPTFDHDDQWTGAQLDFIAKAVRERCGPATSHRVRATLEQAAAPVQQEAAGEIVTPEMIAAGAAAAREYMERTGGNSPEAIYRAMRGAALAPSAVVAPTEAEIATDVLGLEWVHSVLRWAASGYVHTPERMRSLRGAYRVVDRLVNEAAFQAAKGHQ